MKTIAPLSVCFFCVVGFMAACLNAFLSPSGYIYDKLTTLTTTTTTTVTTSEAATTYVYAILVSESTTTVADVQELPDLEEVIE